MGIQAFEPILVEGNAIVIHPLVCAGYNADFDGDQMAVHLPLSLEAQVEALILMLATNNIFSPAHGNPNIAPTQDIVLGIYYLTTTPVREPVEHPKAFTHPQELFLAYGVGKVGIHDEILVRFEEKRMVRDEKGNRVDGRKPFRTTTGRVILNDMLRSGMDFYNYALSKKKIGGLISDCHKVLGKQATLQLLDEIKAIGFKAATRAGLSFAKDDMKVPVRKPEILGSAEKDVDRIEREFRNGAITPGERHNRIIDTWTHAREVMGGVMMEELRMDLRNGKPYLNPIYCMADSGARGAIEQIRQLAGMRGLMAKPSGEIIETPIKSNFREGLQVLEYFSSTHGARKGLADTALKTADSGYLTRKLADVAQNVVVNEYDCGTLNGVTKGTIYRGDKVEVPLSRAIRGRCARDTIVDVITDEVIVREGDLITDEIAARIEGLGYEKIRVRSGLTCETPLGVCARCYGMDLSIGKMVEQGMAVGIIAAHSIGEPGTQLTMRTFHWGGTAVAGVREHDIRAKFGGKVKYHGLQVVTNDEGQDLVLNRKGEIVILDKRDREVDRHEVPSGSVIKLKEGATAKKNQILCEWDPNNTPILAETRGVVRFDDIIEGKTVKTETDRATGTKHMVVMEHKGDLHPQVIIEDEKGQPLGLLPVPEKAHIMIADGQKIKAGTLIAKTPREITGTQDIVGGLPRVTELFEARKPKEPAVMSEIDGVVEIGEKRRGKRTIIVNNESGISREHLVPHGKHLWVKRGDHVKAGEALTEGPLVPHDILRILDEEALHDYLLREIQNVYRSQGVPIDDKHIEIVLGQMLRKVTVDDPGDSEFLPGIVVDKFRFRAENRRLIEENKQPAKAQTVLLGITKASLQSDSFISAASFQETTKVLTEASLAGKRDELLGLKENVILGHLVPVGTGFKRHHRTRVKKNYDLSELPGFAPEGSGSDDSALLDLTGLSLADMETGGESPGVA